MVYTALCKDCKKAGGDTHLRLDLSESFLPTLAGQGLVMSLHLLNGRGQVRRLDAVVHGDGDRGGGSSGDGRLDLADALQRQI